MNQTEIEATAKQAYAEAAEMLLKPEMASVVTHGMNILYGPPMVEPDLAIVTFQGGGADKHIQKAWPERLLYLDDPYPFGVRLRKYAASAGLLPTLRTRTVAIPAIFPQAPDKEAGSWMARSGPKAQWRQFSMEWGARLLQAQKPKVILVYGQKASGVLGLEWRDAERKHSQTHMTFGRSEWRGIPAVFSRHLSSGCAKQEAINCLRVVGELLSVL